MGLSDTGLGHGDASDPRLSGTLTNLARWRLVWLRTLDVKSCTERCRIGGCEVSGRVKVKYPPMGTGYIYHRQERIAVAVAEKAQGSRMTSDDDRVTIG